MAVIEELKYDVLFISVALILAYGLYTTIGLALGTSIPVVAVTSGSMEPELQRGDLIIVKGEPFDEIEVQDIIIYQTEYMSVPIIHRVIDRTDGTLETKGDDNTHQVSACVFPNGDHALTHSCSTGSMQPIRVNGQETNACVFPNGQYAITNSCSDGRLVNLEKGITRDQVLGTAFFIVPEVGNLKLIPTCFYMQLTGQIPPNSPVC